MSERVSDEQVAALASGSLYDHQRSLAREVQEWRALINGGPCPTCGGTTLGNWSTGGACPDCTNGRTPGLADRLDLMEEELRLHGTIGFACEVLAAVIADLQSMRGDT